MFNKILLAFRNYPALRTTFLALSGAVFALLLGSKVLLAFLAPEQYASTAIIKVQRTGAKSESYQRYVVGSYDPYFIQNQFDLIQSDSVLGRVAKKLNLAESWGNRSAGVALSEADTLKLLQERVNLRPVRNTALIEVSARSRNAREASNIANVPAETYRDVTSDERQSASRVEAPTSRLVEIVDTAVPALRPVRPNRPSTVFLGLLGRTFLASLVGGAGVLLVLLRRRLSRPPQRLPAK